MITLAATDTLQGSAGTATAVTYTVLGMERNTSTLAEVYKRLAGPAQLPTSAGVLYTVPATTAAFVKTILLANTTASAVSILLYANGTAAANQIVSLPVPANGEAVFNGEGWHVYDSNGALVTTSIISLTGDVTGSGASPVATTVANDAVTNAKLANVATATIKGRTTAGTGDPEDLTATQAKGVLAITNADVSGLGTLATQNGTFSGTHSGSSSGTNTGDQTITLSTDVTGSGTGAITATIANNAVTNAKAADVPTATFKGRTTAATGDPEDLTVTQATALLNVATTALKGLQSAADKLKQDNEWYDIVAQGGADRTGAVDATAIIQAAIDAVAAAGGGVVFIPRGTYKVTAAITITGAFVTVRGASRVASKLVPTHATGNVFTVSGIFNRFEYLRIEPASSTLRTANYAIEFTSTASNCSCQWVDILFMWSAIRATGQLCRLEDMNIRECGYGAVNGCMVLIDSFTDQYLSKIVCDNGVTPPNAPQATFAGVRITNLSSLLMSDCQIIHCQVGLDVAPAGTNTIPSIYCMNTFFDNGTIGAKFVSGSGNIYRSRFIGVWFSSNSTAGVQLNGAVINGLDFIGCEFYGNPLGIEALAATEWSVRASRFAGNTTNAIKTTAGAAHAFSISDNVIGNVSGFGANAQGINVQAGTYKRYQILDNRGLESNTTPGVIDLGAVAAADQKNVANNMGAVLKGAVATLAAPLSVPVTTETLVLNARIPANGVSVGQVFRIRAVGVAAGANVPTWRVRAGALGTVAGDAVSATIATAATVANGRIACEFYVTVRSATTIETEGVATQSLTATTAGTSHGAIAVAATSVIASTADWFIDLTLAQTINSALIQTAVIEAL